MSYFLSLIPPEWKEQIQSYEKKGVSFKDLSKHIDKLKKAKPNGFMYEFRYIEQKTYEQSALDHKSALKPCNRPKNRYSNVLPIEDTRVQLEEIEGEEGSDYINANWIDGLIPGSEKTYIATQGPLPNTFGDFWRMVWEKNSCIVVMLTKEVENGRLKCEKYWPDEEPFEHGPFKVTLEDQNTDNPELIIRAFKIENSKEKTKRTIMHFQYTAWPDHGLPPSTRAFIELMDDTEKENKTNGPIIVHCSAGIGRSGVFCVCHSTRVKLKNDLKNGVKEPRFNMIEVLLHMRAKRPGIVQTQEQYQFCYVAINEEARKLLGMKDEEEEDSLEE